MPQFGAGVLDSGLLLVLGHTLSCLQLSGHTGSVGGGSPSRVEEAAPPSRAGSVWEDGPGVWGNETLIRQVFFLPVVSPSLSSFSRVTLSVLLHHSQKTLPSALT